MLDESFSGTVVGMVRGLTHSQYRREANIGAFQDGAPFITGLFLEYSRQLFFPLRPALSVHAGRHLRRVDTHDCHELVIEFNLDWRDGDCLTVLGLVIRIHMRAAIEKVRFPLIKPPARRVQTAGKAQHGVNPIQHGSIDNLAPARRPGLQDGGEDTDSEKSTSAAKITDQCQGRRWRHASVTNSMQRARQCDVIEIMARRPSQGPILPPAGDPAVNQLCIAYLTIFRSKA